jgi:Flp pilus assembly protein TadD
LLLAATAWVYAPTRSFQYLNWDDDQYVTEHPRVQHGLMAANLPWLFAGSHGGNWHPLATLSHMLDVSLWGMRPGPPHVENVALHLANTLLVWLVLARLTGASGRSLIVAGLFALHPLHVESVAWVSERKDVLCALFWWLTIAAYARWAREPSSGRFALLAVAFAVALLSKAMAVTLPVVFLLLDHWPLRRERTARELLVEKLPLFGLSVVAAGLTFAAQWRFGAVQALVDVSWPLRLANAAISYVTYLQQMLWPTHLACFYPYSVTIESSSAERARFLAQGAAAALALASVSWLAVRFRRQAPYLFVGWFWYLVTLLPVVGIVSVGTQAHADRYSYLPLVGVWIALVWAVADLLGSLSNWKATSVAVIVLLGALAVQARRQVLTWRDSETLFRHDLAVIGPNSQAYLNLGMALGAQGRTDEAMLAYRHAIDCGDRDVRARNNLGALLCLSGQTEAAIREYRRAIELNSRTALVRENLGEALLTKGEPLAATEQLSEAVKLDPASARAHWLLGRARIALGQSALAEQEFRAAVQLKPDWAEAHNNLGAALFSRGKFDEAATEFDAALALDPALIDARANRAWVLAERGRLDDARRELSEILKLPRLDATVRERIIATARQYGVTF